MTLSDYNATIVSFEGLSLEDCWQVFGRSKGSM